MTSMLVDQTPCVPVYANLSLSFACWTIQDAVRHWVRLLSQYARHMTTPQLGRLLAAMAEVRLTRAGQGKLYNTASSHASVHSGLSACMQLISLC
jgi:hypothetical protein